MASYSNDFEAIEIGFSERTLQTQPGFQKSWNLATAKSFSPKSADAIAETVDGIALSHYNATDTPSELRR